ncbi:MAG: tRNA (guanosine(46)-N7)-methyltransferase TrmB [Bacilli bacterium]
MRLRNVKNKETIMANSEYLVINPTLYKGKWHTLFNNDNPIYLEIGMGKGQFLINNALRYPDINFIGIEKYDSVIARAIEHIPLNLPNIKVVRVNAMEVDNIFLKEITILFLNFSDPWPKNRQENRRLTSKVFLDKYKDIFLNNQVIIQKTDNRQLFEYSLIEFSKSNYKIEEISLDLHHSEIADNIMTEFEEKFAKEGKPIYRVVVTKE